MAIYAQSSCTLSTITDVEAVYTYYYLSDSTITVDEAPKDGVNPPGASTITIVSDGENYVWQITEPQLDIQDDVIQTAVGKLYYIECVQFSDGTYDWGPLMTSSTYAAAKAAYNLSSQALSQAQAANNATALLGGHFIYNSTWQTNNTPHSANVVQTITKNGADVSQDPTKWDYNAHIGSNGIRLRNNESILSEWTSTALKFNNPSNGLAQLIIGANGTLQSGNYIYTEGNIFSDAGTKIDLTTGDIFTRYFRVLSTNAGGNNTGAYIEGDIVAKTGRFGSSENNYWLIDTFYDANEQENYSSLQGIGQSFIQMGSLNTWTLSTTRINSSWRYLGSESTTVTNPFLLRYKRFGTTVNDKYYDYGMNIPTILNNSDQNAKQIADKFLYIRYADYVADNNLDNLNSDSRWTYPFYVDSQGNVRAKAFYIGNSTTAIGGGSGTIAEKLDGPHGNAAHPIYFNAGGEATATTYELNAAGAKNVITDLTANPNSTDLPTAAAITSYVTSRGYITSYTDEKVKTSVNNTAKIYLVGTTSDGTSTGTLNFDSNVYINTTAGALHATTFNGYTLAAASAKGVDTSISAASTSVNLPTSKAVAAFVEGKGYLTSFTETDPTVPDWAKASTKPSYALSEITGADDIKAIEALTGTSGFLKKTKANTWTLDTNTYLTSYTETDPIFVASVAYSITSEDIGNWNSKTSNTGTVTSVQVQATSPVVSSQNTAQTGTLNTTISLSNAYGDTKNPYGTKTANYVLAGPSSGTAAAPSFRKLVAADIPELAWSKITSGTPTTLSGYGITDAKISDGVITLGSNTITPFTGVAVTNLSVGQDTTDNKFYLYITKSNSSTPQKLSLEDISIVQAEGATTLVDSTGTGLDVAGPVYFDEGIPKSMKPTSSTGKFLKDDGTWATPGGTYSLPLAANGTRGGVQIGYSESGKNYAVKLSSEKMYVSVPWTDTNYYHTSGSWDGLKYTATEVGSPGELSFTIPTGTTATTVAIGNHSHGNITNGGDITATAPTIASGDQIIINDNSASKITNGPTFDGSTTTKALSQKGTWETFSKFSGSYDDLSNKPEIPTVPSNIVNTITTTAGAHSAITSQKGNVSFNIPTTAAHVGIKFGYATSGNNRAVLQDTSGNLYVTQKDTNYYHTSGSWGGTNNLTYTATANGGAGALAFTLPSASTSAYGVVKLTDTYSSTNSTNAMTGKAVASAISGASGTYVTLNTNQTLTAAGTKTYLGLQTYGSDGLALGINGNNTVTQKAIMKYNSTLDAIVFSFA